MSQSIDSLIQKVRSYNGKGDTRIIREAYEFARTHHADQMRRSGEEFILHPLGVAHILADMQMDETTLAAALLHDVVEDTEISLDEVKRRFGPAVAEIIDGVTKLDRITFANREEAQAENFRKMFVAMARDIRVVIIKLADRLDNMKTIGHLSEDKQREKARETLEIYAPLAHRLGISQLKWQLEDLSFATLYPLRFQEIVQMVNQRRPEREDYIQQVKKDLQAQLKQLGETVTYSTLSVEISERGHPVAATSTADRGFWGTVKHSFGLMADGFGTIFTAFAALAQDNTPAKVLFGQMAQPADLQSRSIGSYARGCLAGANPLPLDGPAWQVMRLSRNRNWGHPDLVALVERLAKDAKKLDGWNGLLVGDLAQPRGGPMLTGHASHQVGLDADIWLTPMPNRRLSREEREETSAVMMVRSDRLDIDPHNWKPTHLGVIRAAAQEPSVQRIFVNAAIKKALCREAKGDRGWLSKVRPMYGHNYHFHVRMHCPKGDATCADQDPVGVGDGCDESLDHWFSDAILHPKPNKPGKPKPPMTMAALPQDCKVVLKAK